MRLVYIDCKFCKGTGEFLGRECKNCRARGQIPVKVSDDDLYTTDYKKCKENAETIIYRKFLKNVNWENLDYTQLKKIYDLVSDIIISKENKRL